MSDVICDPFSLQQNIKLLLIVQVSSLRHVGPKSVNPSLVSSATGWLASPGIIRSESISMEHLVISDDC